MAARIDAYVDTSAFIAFMDASDTYHAVFRRLFSAPPSVVVTTSLVIAEGHGWFLRRFDRVRALQFLAMEDLTLADAVGLVLMRDAHVRSCWSTDRRLGLTGAPLAIHAA
ncbi:MAG TPA: PIN domain-containing protein [Pseudomonadales bacterium]|nr:PIN domain-containing protein [Pseudomonadales bacterium]